MERGDFDFDGVDLSSVGKSNGNRENGDVFTLRFPNEVNL
jgi:hypothetical protein